MNNKYRYKIEQMNTTDDQKTLTESDRIFGILGCFDRCLLEKTKILLKMKTSQQVTHISCVLCEINNEMSGACKTEQKVKLASISKNQASLIHNALPVSPRKKTFI